MIIIILENKKVISWTIQAIVFPSTLSSSNLLYTYITHRCLDITSQWGVDWQTFSEEIAKQSRSTRRKKRPRKRKRNLLKKPFFALAINIPIQQKEKAKCDKVFAKQQKVLIFYPKVVNTAANNVDRLESDVCPTDSRLTYSILMMLVPIDYNVMTNQMDLLWSIQLCTC